MITFKKSINNPNEYQCGNIPHNAKKMNSPSSINEMMKKATPIAIILCLIMMISMFIKTYVSNQIVIHPIAILFGFLIGFALLLVHELLHAIVFPKKADVTIGKLKGKLVFVALASYPLKKTRFIVMCLLPFLLGIIPLIVFAFSPADKTILNGLMFGMAGIGMVSPFPDGYNDFLVLKPTKNKDSIMFYEDDIYRIPNN